VLIVFLGLYPKPMLDRIEPSVERLLAHVDAEVEGFELREVKFVAPLPGEVEAGHSEAGKTEAGHTESGKTEAGHTEGKP
ncbi:MAG: hypothetical protein F2744_11430, partial [Actinobacteria bacterium]|nr:hypothetical protein [Actinomycetota bacterium]